MNKKDVIKLSSSPNHINLDGSLKKKRVAVYARVSSKKELQMSSFELQISTYQNLINSNPLWELAGIFADYGKSGTSVTKRREFMKMVEIARLGEIDIIITKSISRFTRDIVSGLKTIQELRDLGVEIRFEKENINTTDTSFDFFLTIFTSVAEEEAKSNSSNVLWSYKKKMTNGGNTTFRLFGYNTDKNGELIINKEQAPAVKLIFELYTEGKTLNVIIDELHKQGYKTINGNPKFSLGTIKEILRNEKYCGNMLLQKTAVTKIGSKESKPNMTKPKYYVTNSHEGIISIETFNKAQQIKKERSLIYNKSRNETPTFIYTTYVYSVIANKFYRSKLNHKNTKHEVKLLEVIDNNRNRILDAKNIYYRQIDMLLEAGSNELFKNVNLLKTELQDELNHKLLKYNINKNIETLDEQIMNLKNELENINLLNVDQAVKSQFKDSLTNKINDLSEKLLALRHQKIMRFTYEKNIPLLLRKINRLKNNKDANLKELFNYVIAIDRNELLLCIHLSNRNIGDIDLNDEINNKKLKSGTFNFIQTRLNIDVKWGIIVI